MFWLLLHYDIKLYLTALIDYDICSACVDYMQSHRTLSEVYSGRLEEKGNIWHVTSIQMENKMGDSLKFACDFAVEVIISDFL
jgi:hypothetical protein